MAFLELDIGDEEYQIKRWCRCHDVFNGGVGFTIATLYKYILHQLRIA